MNLLENNFTLAPEKKKKKRLLHNTINGIPLNFDCCKSHMSTFSSSYLSGNQIDVTISRKTTLPHSNAYRTLSLNQVLCIP